MANFARQGQPLRIPANDWNDLLRLRDVARKSGLLGAGGAFRFRTATPERQFLISVDSGLDINVLSGKAWTWDATNGRQQIDAIDGTTTAITLDDNDTSGIYLKATVTPNAFASYYIMWTTDTFTFEANTSEPTATADFSDAVSGGGDVYVKIADVTTVSGEVTGIDRVVTETVDFLWPWTMDFATFSCPE